MSNIEKDTTSPKQPANQTPADEAISQKLEELADEMADKAGEREIRYDQNHDIFTK